MATEPSTSKPPQIISSSPGQDTTSYDHHSHRRFFLGPMPEKVLSQIDTQHREHKKNGFLHILSSENSNDEPEDERVRHAFRQYAFQFFMRQGGNAEDWGELAERRVNEEMITRWRHSEWGGLFRRSRKKENATTRRWFGGTFEIGTFLGVNMIAGTTRPSPRSQKSASSSRTLGSRVTDGQSSAGAETFFTAQSSMVSPLDSVDPRGSGSRKGSSDDANGREIQPSTSTTSSTALLASSRRPGFSNKSLSKARLSHLSLRSILKAAHSEHFSEDAAKSTSHPTPPPMLRSGVKGKGKSVHYQVSASPPREEPASPTEVLARSGTEVEDTSAGAAVPEHGDVSQTIQQGDVFMRDRMLVRISYTKSESFGRSFDENQDRMINDLAYEDWDEFMVVWRTNRIEIYEDYTLIGKEWLHGHKHLAFVIPLRTNTTHLSLYSFVDLTFCLTCKPTSVHISPSKARAIFHRSEEGMNVFVFKVKSRTRAVDWFWHLWRHFGGEIPSSIEVHCPAVETRVRIDMPTTDVVSSEKARVTYSRENILALCRQSLSSISDWKHVFERALASGKSLELGWCMDAYLDWIWLQEDEEGKPRDGAVLCGLALKQAEKVTHLQLRLGNHFPATLHLKDGTKFNEPPAIEGYLTRVTTQVRHQLYLVSHDGYLFSLPPGNAHPPAPPNVHPPEGDPDEFAASMRESEVMRGAQQIKVANGVFDFKNFKVIRRATKNEGDRDVEEGTASRGIQDFNTFTEIQTDSDQEDEGGDEGLDKCKDKTILKMKRSFELVMNSGHVLKFEAFSCRAALEWINFLRPLTRYWKQRHRIDAKEEMDLARSASSRPRITPVHHASSAAHRNNLPPESLTNPQMSMPALGSVFNWCTINNCRSIIRAGRVFLRQGLRGQYKPVHLFLVPGRLMQYHVVSGASLHRRRSEEIDLLDAYVCSGYFAVQTLPKNQFKPGAHNIPRRYQDGLEVDDPEEDMLFVIWFHKNKTSQLDNGASANQVSVPSLSSKKQVTVVRTRSKVERDAWCCAINYEIEKLVRANKDRERLERETGGLVAL